MRIAVAFDHAGVGFLDVVGDALRGAGHAPVVLGTYDDCDVLCVGSRMIGPLYAAACIAAYTQAEFSGEARHARRLHKIDQLNRRGFDAEPPTPRKES